MKAITFLGTGKYELTIYKQGEVCCTTRFFAEMLPYIYPELEAILVVTTPTARQHANFAALRSLLNELFVEVPIPEGHSESDLWAIFDAITQQIGDGEEVVFDITNSFRSLPFLTLLAAAYLRVAKGVHLRSVIYGAYEARNKEANISPVFDLTPFVGLLDWVTAADQFIQTGDARRLAGLMDRSAAGTAQDAAKALHDVSLSAFLCQPFELMPKAAQLGETLNAATEELDQFAKPVGPLQERIVNTFGAFGVASDGSPDSFKDELVAQYRMIEWYYKGNQWMQAVTLAREWLISAATWRLGLPLDRRQGKRGDMEKAVAELGLVGQLRPVKGGSQVPFAVGNLNQYGQTIYRMWPERDDLIALWDVLRRTRNTLDHAGYQHNAMLLRNIENVIGNEVMPRLRHLAVDWGLAAQSPISNLQPPSGGQL